MEDPILVTMNTSDTTERPGVEETSGTDRLCTVESIPALHSGFSENLSEQKRPRSEKGGELDTQRHSTTRNADKRNFKKGPKQSFRRGQAKGYNQE